MPRKPTGYSPEMRRIFETALGTMSQTAAELLTQGQISRGTFGRALQGKILTAESYATIGGCLADKFKRHYEAQITELYGRCTGDTVGEWLAFKAGLIPPPAATKATAAQLLDAMAFHGADELPQEDLVTLSAVVQAFISSRRSTRGLT